jgi:biotin operon repressor
MKLKTRILKLWGKRNPNTGKPWSKRSIASKVGCSRQYVIKIIKQYYNEISHLP